ncbi:MAG TPA: hypothetical protein VL485_22780 [Ktedonobacteraceae bacterium]|jgi:hypothetical protein|nr:hypothetical protein [Ktedonobacteraceae bacterium]
MSTNMPPVIGVFNESAMADRAIGALSNVGFSSESISYAGVSYGGGFLASLKSLFMGGEERTTHVLHDLMRMGVPEEQARYYAGEYHAGHPLIAVRAAGHEQEAMQVMRSIGGYDYNSRPGLVRGAAAPTGYAQPERAYQDRDRARGGDVDVGGNATATDRTAYENQIGSERASQAERERATYAEQQPHFGYSGPAPSQPQPGQPVSPPPQTGYPGPATGQPPQTGYSSQVAGQPPQTGQQPPLAGYPSPATGQPQQPGPVTGQAPHPGYPSPATGQPAQTGYPSPATGQPQAGPVTGQAAQTDYPSSTISQPQTDYPSSTISQPQAGPAAQPGPATKQPHAKHIDRTDMDTAPGMNQTGYPEQSGGTDIDRPYPHEDSSR